MSANAVPATPPRARSGAASGLSSASPMKGLGHAMGSISSGIRKGTASMGPGGIGLGLGVGAGLSKFNPMGRSSKNVFEKNGPLHSGLAALEEEETDELGMSRLDDELAQFTAKQFDADGYATSFFEEHPFIEVKRRCRELVAMRKAAEQTLQETVSKNYGPFLVATARINEVESELATLGAALRGLRVTLDRLGEGADRAVKDRVATGDGGGGGGSAAVGASGIGQGHAGGGKKARRVEMGRSVSSAAVPAFIWAAPVTIADEMRERRFKPAALLVAEVRRWRDTDAPAALFQRIFAEGSATPQGALQRAADRRRAAISEAQHTHDHGSMNHGSMMGGGGGERRMLRLAAVGAGSAFSGGGFDDVVTCLAAVEDMAVDLCTEISRECLSMSMDGDGSVAEGDGGTLLAAVWGTRSSGYRDSLAILLALGDFDTAAQTFTQIVSAHLHRSLLPIALAAHHAADTIRPHAAYAVACASSGAKDSTEAEARGTATSHALAAAVAAMAAAASEASSVWGSVSAGGVSMDGGAAQSARATAALCGCCFGRLARDVATFRDLFGPASHKQATPSSRRDKGQANSDSDSDQDDAGKRRGGAAKEQWSSGFDWSSSMGSVETLAPAYRRLLACVDSEVSFAAGLSLRAFAEAHLPSAAALLPPLIAQATHHSSHHGSDGHHAAQGGSGGSKQGGGSGLLGVSEAAVVSTAALRRALWPTPEEAHAAEQAAKARDREADLSLNTLRSISDRTDSLSRSNSGASPRDGTCVPSADLAEGHTAGQDDDASGLGLRMLGARRRGKSAMEKSLSRGASGDPFARSDTLGDSLSLALAPAVLTPRDAHIASLRRKTSSLRSQSFRDKSADSPSGSLDSGGSFDVKDASPAFAAPLSVLAKVTGAAFGAAQIAAVGTGGGGGYDVSPSLARRMAPLLAMILAADAEGGAGRVRDAVRAEAAATAAEQAASVGRPSRAHRAHATASGLYGRLVVLRPCTEALLACRRGHACFGALSKEFVDAAPETQSEAQSRTHDENASPGQGLAVTSGLFVACVELSAFLDGALTLLYAPLHVNSDGTDDRKSPLQSTSRLCDLCGLGEAEGLEAAVAAGAAHILRAFAKAAAARGPTLEDLNFAKDQASIECSIEGGEGRSLSPSAMHLAALTKEVRGALGGCTTIRAADFV